MTETLGEWYLSNADGDLVTYYQGLRAGHRVGQAFFNALSSTDKERVRGTIVDPFYHEKGEGNKKIEQAIIYLVDSL